MTASGSSTGRLQPAADEAFHPRRHGFEPDGTGWRRTLAGIGGVVIRPLRWEHAHLPSYEDVEGTPVPMDALRFLVELQRRTWGLPPEDLVPANLLSVLADTGGSVLVAYRHEQRFNADGWLGFAIAAGARSGTLVSHMLGVRDELRGVGDLGWHLKVVQAHEALRAGHTAATWTFDPMRGANARLNIEKLGARVELLTIDKYGLLPSSLYGEDVPSDRFTASWDLASLSTTERIDAVRAGTYQSLTPANLLVPEVTPANVAAVAASGVERVRYRIPGDIDQMVRTDPSRALAWRQEMRAVLTSLITTRRAVVAGDPAEGVCDVSVDERPGDYVIDGFASGVEPAGERVSFYVLSRR